MRIDKSLSLKAFKEKYPDKIHCLQYLANIKWSEGYVCKKCSSNTYSKGKQPFSRRCTKCLYDESPTANTLFHKLKFSIEVAFEMLYEIVTSKKGANSIWLTERFSVQQKTTWLFRQKVQEAMKSSQQYALDKIVHVDEFEIGTPKKGQQGRSASTEKVRVVIAIEYRDGSAGRGYAQVISDYSCKSLKPIFEQHIASDALIETDGWSGYKPLKEEYPNLTQKLFQKGENFKMLHLQIRNVKNWLRRVHSYCNKEYVDKHLQEYFYRFNRRNHRNTIFSNILNRMTVGSPIVYLQLKKQAI
jgi:hypothetical protein